MAGDDGPPINVSRTLTSVRARDALEMWAIEKVVEHVDREVNSLCNEPPLGTSRAALSWSFLRGFSFRAVQAKVSTAVPLLWTILTTSAIRKQKSPSRINQRYQTKDGHRRNSRDRWLVSCDFVEYSQCC